MTSSIILPRGTQGEGLSGMNSHPQINWVQCLVAFWSRRENLLYQRTLYIPSPSCFLFRLPVFYGTMEDT